MPDLELDNPILKKPDREIIQTGLDFDFDEAQAPEARETVRECRTCWKWQECELRKTGARGCAEIF
jgi:hypothetical protein